MKVCDLHKQLEACDPNAEVVAKGTMGGVENEILNVRTLQDDDGLYFGVEYNDE